MNPYRYSDFCNLFLFFENEKIHEKPSPTFSQDFWHIFHILNIIKRLDCSLKVLQNISSQIKYCVFFQDVENLYITYAICHLASMTSAISNPILYGFMNENFRQEFSKIWNRSGFCALNFLTILSTDIKKAEQFCKTAFLEL